MQYITEYIRNSYMTLMLLAGLVVILIANRRTKIEGTQYVWAIMGIVFTITVFEYLEKWCDTYNKPVWILYFKALFTYSLYPLLMIMELFLIARVKHKLLILIPYFIEIPFLVEVTDTGSGRSSITKKQQTRKGIGIENVRRRLRSMSKGELEMITGEHGTTARITIADDGGNNDNTIS